MISLLDGDIVCYRAGFAAEHTKYVILDEDGRPLAGPFDSAKERNEWIKDKHGEEGLPKELSIDSFKEYEPLSHALSNVKSIIDWIHDEIGTGHIFLSRGENFRHGLATMLKYKGNRDDAPRPKWYHEIREYMVNQHGAVVFESIEADDVLAMAQTDKTVICSVDKDLLQVPGMHYNWVRDKNEKYDGNGKVFISEDVGLRKLYQQVLTGDSTDNIPGIYRCGEVTARKAIAGCENEDAMIWCTGDRWASYLSSDLKKPVTIEYDGVGCYEYLDWEGDACSATSDDIRDEVYNLVKVGGEHAEEAANTSGEEVLIPR